MAGLLTTTTKSETITVDGKEYGEVTGPQVVHSTVDLFTGEMHQPTVAGLYDWYDTVREMRKDPTIKLARLLSIAPALCTDWSVTTTKEAPKGAAEFIEREIIELRSHILEHAMLPMTDYGWAPFEKVLYRREGELNLSLKKLKPLLHRITTITIDRLTGRFTGFLQYPNLLDIRVATGPNGKIPLEIDKCLLFSQNVQGTDWYGTGDLEAAYLPYARWNDSDAVSRKFDQKTAGAHWVVRYPVGSTLLNGQLMSNDQIAQQLVASLQSNGSIILPNSIKNAIGTAIKGGGNAGNMLTTAQDWTIELLESKGNASVSMKERQAYLDVLKVRAFGMPERALIEGQHGTKAEAEAHANVALTYIAHKHNNVRITVNKHLVNHLLRVNYGEQYHDTVQVVASKIGADEKAFLRELYTTLMGNPSVALAELDSIDFGAIRDMINVPENPDAEDTMTILKELLDKKRDTAQDPPTPPIQVPLVPPVPPEDPEDDNEEEDPEDDTED